MIISMIEIHCIPAHEAAFQMEMSERLIIDSDTNLYPLLSSNHSPWVGRLVGKSVIITLDNVHSFMSQSVNSKEQANMTLVPVECI